MAGGRKQCANFSMCTYQSKSLREKCMNHQNLDFHLPWCVKRPWPAAAQAADKAPAFEKAWALLANEWAHLVATGQPVFGCHHDTKVQPGVERADGIDGYSQPGD
jgi:hypothetical protein